MPTLTYTIQSQGNFGGRIFISEVQHNLFVGTIVIIDGNTGQISTHTHHGNTANDVYDLCNTTVNQMHDGRGSYNIVQP